MPVTDAFTKSDRLLEVQVLLLHRPEGVKTAEIAELLGVSQRTARRYLFELSDSGRLPVYKDGWYWKLTPGAKFDLLPVRLNLDEAMALYLSARLLATYSDKHNPHAVDALFKLASAMPEPIRDHIVRTAEAVVQRRHDPRHIEVLEKLTQAWSERRQVQQVHRKAQTGEVSERVFDVYFIEPLAAGYSCYVYGHDHLREDIRVFKMERIQGVELLGSRYENDERFDPYAYLRNAWGIMGGDGVVEVKLRFTPQVTYRVRESDWPGVASIEDEPSGGCVMTLRVNHVLEMKPWIRGWGADCEVLEPEDLRREIAGEMRRAGAVYG